MKQIPAVAAITVLAGYISPATAQDVAAGKVLYERNCEACHGNSGQGGVGKKLAGDAAYWQFDVFKRAVLTGIDDAGRHMKIMPVFGKTGLPSTSKPPSDDNLKNIQAYLKTFGPKR